MGAPANDMQMIPRKLGKEPILEVAAEMRFGPSAAQKTSIIPGLVYSKFGTQFPNVENLPTLPIALDSEPFSLMPSHRFTGDDGMISLTPRSVIFHAILQYPGWHKFRTSTESIFSFAAESGVFGTIERVSIKYVNLLPCAISEDQLAITTAKLSLAGRAITNERTVLRVEYARDNLIGIVQLGTRVQSVATENRPAQEGTLVDIDVVANGPFGNATSAMAALDAAHAYEKELFFSLVDPEHLKSYDPQY